MSFNDTETKDEFWHGVYCGFWLGFLVAFSMLVVALTI